MPTDHITGDAPVVFEMEAKLLAAYAILTDLDHIMAKLSDAELRIIATSTYVAQIGSEIPDATIRAAVKKLAASKFQQHGIDVPNCIG